MTSQNADDSAMYTQRAPAADTGQAQASSSSSSNSLLNVVDFSGTSSFWDSVTQGSIPDQDDDSYRSV